MLQVAPVDAPENLSLVQVLLRDTGDLYAEWADDGWVASSDYTDAEKAATNSFFNKHVHAAGQVSVDSAGTTRFTMSYDDLKYDFLAQETPGVKQLYVHTIWSNGSSLEYKVVSVVVDVRKAAGVDPDRTCAPGFCEFKVLPHLDGADISDMWSCDSETGEWGGRLKNYVSTW